MGGPAERLERTAHDRERENKRSLFRRVTQWQSRSTCKNTVIKTNNSLLSDSMYLRLTTISMKHQPVQECTCASLDERVLRRFTAVSIFYSST